MIGVRNVSDLANELLEAQWQLSELEALQLAVKIQHNQILAQAHVVLGEGHPSELTPSALEAIAIEMGAGKNGGVPIKEALSDIADAINCYRDFMQGKMPD